MKNRILILTLAAVLGAGGLFAIKAHAAEAGVRRAPGALLQRAKERLGITDAQAAQIREVLKADRETLAGLARQVHAAHVDLRAVIQKDAATDREVRAAASKLGQAQADMAVERHKLFGKIKPVLTPEQLDRLAEMQDRLDQFLDGAISNIEARLGE
jgi:Spy/CpxP family protein refolding chaperone